MKKLVVFLFIGFAITIYSCKTVPILDSMLSYQELCSIERAGILGCKKCKPDGNITYIFDIPRPSVDINSAYKRLGNIIDPEDMLHPIAEIDFGLRDLSFYRQEIQYELRKEPNAEYNYFYYSFDREINIEIIKDADIEATIRTVLETALKISDSAERLKIINNISSSIIQKLHEESFTKARFQIITLKDYVISELMSDTSNDPQHPLYQIKCALIKNPDYYMIESIALITSSGSLSKQRTNELNDIINSELQQYNIEDIASIAAELSISLIKTFDEKIQTETSNHASIYGYGLWKLKQ